MSKEGRTKIPNGIRRVKNAVTGETKIWCARCKKWGDHSSTKHFNAQ